MRCDCSGPTAVARSRWHSPRPNSGRGPGIQEKHTLFGSATPLRAFSCRNCLELSSKPPVWDCSRFPSHCGSTAVRRLRYSFFPPVAPFRIPHQSSWLRRPISRVCFVRTLSTRLQSSLLLCSLGFPLTIVALMMAMLFVLVMS